ncbi:hypothetical protein M5K25_022055 [Dendrobium thyrsiflorum]|uniref:Uncharacterized protein n=1 Tax=Dendrobium thyrsiflorum TaxID=117978 RepID=A0ABD0U5L2_DENTH
MGLGRFHVIVKLVYLKLSWRRNLRVASPCAFVNKESSSIEKSKPRPPGNEIDSRFTVLLPSTLIKINSLIAIYAGEYKQFEIALVNIFWIKLRRIYGFNFGNFTNPGAMAAKKVDALEERLEGEMNQIKTTVEERMSSMEGQVADLRDMIKKMLEVHNQMTASVARSGEGRSTNSEIRREEEEAEIVEGERRRPHLEPEEKRAREGHSDVSCSLSLSCASFAPRSLLDFAPSTTFLPVEIGSSDILIGPTAGARRAVKDRRLRHFDGSKAGARLTVEGSCPLSSPPPTLLFDLLPPTTFPSRRIGSYDTFERKQPGARRLRSNFLPPACFSGAAPPNPVSPPSLPLRLLRCCRLRFVHDLPSCGPEVTTFLAEGTTGARSH